MKNNKSSSLYSELSQLTSDVTCAINEVKIRTFDIYIAIIFLYNSVHHYQEFYQ